MKKSNLFSNFLLAFGLLISVTACAQEHKKNQTFLEKFNTAIKHTVLLNNSNAVLPIKDLTQLNIASVDLGFSSQSVFDSLLNKYAKVLPVSAIKYKDSTHLNDLEDDLKYFNTLIIPIDEQLIAQDRNRVFLQNMAKSKQLILAVFGEGTILSNFDSFSKIPLIWNNKADAVAAQVVAQVVFGGIAPHAKLTKDYSTTFRKGDGYDGAVIRLRYTVPEDAGVNSNNLKEIEEIAKEAIEKKATPGLVVLVAKDNKVIYNKAFGYHTYDKQRADQVTDIFDMASVTKTTATTPSVMRLVEQGKLNLDTTISTYIAKARNTPMANIHVREVMLHQAGFVPYIPFYKFIKEGDYSADSSAQYPTKVADGYYLRKDYFNEVMWPTMLNSPIKTRGRYVYSDISMYVMEDIVEHLSQMPEDRYVLQNFYTPLGMQTAGFNPRNRFPKDRIVPTEDDQVFRKTLLEGYVHDQGAAMKGGVAGHAGLFATANDLAIFYQMMLNKGSYGGQSYFKPETVADFTKKQTENSRRGLGFDRWDPDKSKEYPSKLASPETYGHTGYTGIAAWVDPARNMIYIFLSNRVNPQVSNTLLNLNIRPRIQDVVNKAIDAGL